MRLRIRREAHLPGRAAQGEGNDLARGLARLDVLREEGAVRERRAGVDRVVPLVARLRLCPAGPAKPNARHRHQTER